MAGVAISRAVELLVPSLKDSVPVRALLAGELPRSSIRKVMVGDFAAVPDIASLVLLAAIFNS